MHKLSDEQVDFIMDDIERQGIVTEDVKYNILDHVCCIIENKMPSCENFYTFYKNTIARFYHKELNEIEQQTQELLKFKNYYAMKRTLKITSLISIILIVVGALFKTLHLSSGGIFFVLGIALFSLIFIPVNIMLKFKDDAKKEGRLIMTIGLLIAALIMIGGLFKVMHWPNANVILYAGLLSFLFLFIPVYFFTQYKKPETKFNTIIHSTFMICGCGMLFMLFSQKPSSNIKDSILSLKQFQHENIALYERNNSVLYHEVSIDKKNESINLIRASSQRLLKKIDDIKVHLTEKSNNDDNSSNEL